MFVLLLVIASTAAVPPAQQDDQQVVQSANLYNYRQPSRGSATYQQPSALEDVGPTEVNFPVRTVQKFMDSDGNVQVVTSYSNRNDNPVPIYKAQPINEYDIPQKSGIRIPEGRAVHRETEERSVPKKQQVLRTKSVRFPDNSGQYVENEEKSSYSDGNSKSFSKVSSYDNSYKPSKVVSSRVSQPRQETEYEDDQSYRTGYLKPAIHVPAESEAAPVRQAPSGGRFRSTKSAVESEPLPIADSKNADHALDAEGSSYVSDIEEATDEDDDSYDDAYEEHPIIEPVGHDIIGLHHGPHAHGGPGVIAVGPGGPGIGVIGVADGPHGHGIHLNYKKKDGHGYSHGEQYAKGQKGAKGHKTNEHYDKGHVEKHGHEHNKGGKKEEVGVKKGHLDEHNSYHKGHAHHKGAKGKEKSHSKGHKKGHKTSGFRTVHHKDEYKKDEVFYDEEHDAGHEKVKAHEEGGHQQAKGGESKKGHLDSGYKDAVKGVEGEKKEGHTYETSKGHKGHAGHKHAEGHNEGFQKAGGHKGQEAHGHIHKGKGGGWV
ncbi:protein argonaute-2 [Halyomorpha halys]|uniref:protein argonaute-2 n=1 Tax=Halyomorpha halys TaxID=286706 RepID=UPI0006D52712|nr:uncharacterized protein LOC106684495 [Halyomorpha halys]